MNPKPFGYYFASPYVHGGGLFRLVNDPSVPHLLANPDAYHATPLYAAESDEVRRERETEAVALEARAVGILERMASTLVSSFEFADDCVNLAQSIDELIAPPGTPSAALLFLRDEVNRAVHSGDGYYADDLESTRHHLEELRHPIPLDYVDQ